ncbi:MAG: heme exporter protein CcmB [Pseudomonadota bacterium]
MTPLLALFRRDLSLALRLGGGGGIAVAFFVLVIVLIPLGVGREQETLARIAGGVIWIAALLSALLSLDRLFQADHEDGSLDQFMLTPVALEQVVLAKTCAHWMTTGLPMTAIAPLLGTMLGLPLEVLAILTLAMAVGTPALSLIGAIGAAITVGVRRGGLLMSILVLPLYIPTLIFGAQAVEAALFDLSPWPAMGLLGALTLFAGALSPFTTAAALRINLK